MNVEYIGEYEIINAFIDLRKNICINRLNVGDKIILNYETCKSNGEDLNPFLPNVLIS